MSTRYQPITGNPRRKTKATRSDGRRRAETERSSNRKRKPRVSVTPRDPNLLEEVACELGLPKSKVYNMAFQALLEKIGW